jgi:hypothetical protein
MGFESFWLDEAWSHAMATQAESVSALFTGFRHDNNHLLNTVYLYAVDDAVGSGHWIAYRVPALLAGGLSLWVIFRIGCRWGRLEGLLALALVATSFPLISASAQARGYSGAILCSLLYFALSRRLDDRSQHEDGWRRAWAVFALASIALLGLLSHPTFVYGLAGVVAWTAVDSLERGEGVARATLRVGLQHGLALLTVLVLYAFFFAHLEVGGGPSYDRWVAIQQAIAQTMALPRRGPLTAIAALAAALLVAQGLWVLGRWGGWRARVFFIVTIVLAPAAVIGLSDPELVYARYLVATFPWFYLLVAIGTARPLRAGGAPRWLAAAVLVFLLASNLWQTSRVLGEGRNDYARSLDYIDQRTVGPVIEIGSDHDFRNRVLLRFYGRRLASGRTLVYQESSEWSPEGPEWYLRHDWRAGHAPEEDYEPSPGYRYGLEQTFEHGPGDGFQWFIYRRAR